MTIRHDPHNSMPTVAIVFAALGGFTCSICAPQEMAAHEVEAVAAREVGDMPEHAWRVVDKSKLGMGSSTPNPCNQAADRLHWFLLCEVA